MRENGRPDQDDVDDVNNFFHKEIFEFIVIISLQAANKYSQWVCHLMSSPMGSTDGPPSLWSN